MQEHKDLNGKFILVKRNQFHGWEKEIQRPFELGFDNMLMLFKKLLGTSLVIQWWRIHLPVQGRQVGSLVWISPTWTGAMSHAPQLLILWSKSWGLGVLSPNPQLLKPTTPRARDPQWGKPPQEETWALQLESRRCSLLVEKARTAAKAQESRKETN